MVHHKQPYGKRRAVFLLQFPGTLRRGAPSGTRTARAPRLAYRGAKTSRWGVFRARESPEQSAPQTALRKRKAVFIMIAALCECFRFAADFCQSQRLFSFWQKGRELSKKARQILNGGLLVQYQPVRLCPTMDDVYQAYSQRRKGMRDRLS